MEAIRGIYKKAEKKGLFLAFPSVQKSKGLLGIPCLNKNHLEKLMTFLRLLQQNPLVLCKRKGNGGSENQSHRFIGVKICLLYDGFSFCRRAADYCLWNCFSITLLL